MIIVVVDRGVVGGSRASLLISTPIKANGAHPDIAHGMPATDTRNVANLKDRAIGAKTMVPANNRCERSQAVARLGRIFLKRRSRAATPGGGRAVKLARLLLLSGERTPNGKSTELRKVTDEKMTSDRLPSRPTSPRVSDDLAADSGFS